MKELKVLNPAYDVSGGDHAFESDTFNGEYIIGVQYFYTSLNQADHKIRLQESFDGVNYVDSVDSSGSTIEMTIDNSLSVDILKAYDFSTRFYRFKFIEGTTGTGTIDTLKIFTE